MILDQIRGEISPVFRQKNLKFYKIPTRNTMYDFHDELPYYESYSMTQTVWVVFGFY